MSLSTRAVPFLLDPPDTSHYTRTQNLSQAMLSSMLLLARQPTVLIWVAE